MTSASWAPTSSNQLPPETTGSVGSFTVKPILVEDRCVLFTTAYSVTAGSPSSVDRWAIDPKLTRYSVELKSKIPEAASVTLTSIRLEPFANECLLSLSTRRESEGHPMENNLKNTCDAILRQVTTGKPRVPGDGHRPHH